MEEIITQEEFEKLLNHPGEVRGVAFTTAAEFIKENEGEEGVERMEETIAKLGYPLKYKDMETMQFYPVGLQVINIIVMKKLFGYDDQKVKEMGSFNAKFSLLIRLFMRYFFSIEMAAKVVSEMWRKHYTIGRLVPEEHSEKERYVILKLENFSVHPLLCTDLLGYFSSVVKMVVGKEVRGEETKCVHRGDEYCEFVLRW
ncbi:MAG: hypothetical protein GF370_02020 [Candidatus Nealsonbacteria bacterium]|nr:hypothetical protein [Candidatus Nealsonbacteria bacterium]